ncbi:MAG: DUF4013 domain-containing protein [Pyrinomonadaceae bacterium]
MNEAEVWQVEVNGQIYQTNIDELVQWIYEGAVIREDKVRRGNLRWLEAGKVPKLVTFFNNKDQNIIPPNISANVSQPEVEPEATDSNPVSESTFSTSSLSLNQTQFDHFSQDYPAPPESEQTPFENSQGEETETELRIEENPSQIVNPNACHLHPESEPAFVCDVCASLFCSACPKSYGGTVRTCPLCGGLCREIAGLQAEEERITHYRSEMDRGFGFDDFGKALAYPLRFKTSLIAGGIMFALFTIGQSATGFGGIFMLFGAIFCFMMANMLTFGVLANTVENFSQGRTDRNFMPSFDDFELWNDVIHPFFLCIGVYLVCFGLFLALVIGSFWYVARTFSAAVQEQNTANAEFIQNQRETIAGRRAAPPADSKKPDPMFDEEGNPDEEFFGDRDTFTDDEEQNVQRLQKMIQDHRKGQLESVVGKEPDMNSSPFGKMVTGMIKMAPLFLLGAIITLLWGFFYLPAACLVAGYSRSFLATINPSYGFDTIKRLGGDYFKILLMSFLILIFWGVSTMVLNIVLFPFYLPFIGNLPAIALGSFSTFYLSIVFSVILGFALYRNSEKFNFSAAWK